jgi:hypothetical protein
MIIRILPPYTSPCDHRRFAARIEGDTAVDDGLGCCWEMPGLVTHSPNERQARLKPHAPDPLEVPPMPQPRQMGIIVIPGQSAGRKCEDDHA